MLWIALLHIIKIIKFHTPSAYIPPDQTSQPIGPYVPTLYTVRLLELRCSEESHRSGASSTTWENECAQQRKLQLPPPLFVRRPWLG
jgi:hypothetical protein